MPTVENSKVAVGEKTDSLIFHWEKCSSPCPQRKMLPAANLDDNDEYSRDFTAELVKFSHSSGLNNFISDEELKEELFRISDKTIDLHAKNLLSDSGTDCFLLPDSDDEDEEEEEEETSLDSGNGTRSEEATDFDGEVQDEGGLDDVNRGILPYDISASEDGETSAEDSCEMTYVELDLSSESSQDVSHEEFTKWMKNLIITPRSKVSDSDKFGPSGTKDRFNENNFQNLESKESAEKWVPKFESDVKSENAVNFTHNSDNNLKSEEQTKFLESFLPIKESSLSSLPERTYVQIAEYLLDERMPLKLNVGENSPSSFGSCKTTSALTPNNLLIPSDVALSYVDLNPSLISNETDTYKTCTMTYVDLDISESCSKDETLQMFNDLSIKDDKIPLPRGNPSDQNGFQTYPLCSQIDMSDFEVPAVDSSPILLGMADTEIDLNYFTNGIGIGSTQGFYLSQPFSSSTTFDFAPTPFLPSISNESIAKDLEAFPEANPIDEKMPLEESFWDSSLFPAVDSLIPYNTDSLDISFPNDTLENSEMSYEHEFVTKNLHKLEEVIEILGLPKTESQKTISSLPSTPPLPPSGNNLLLSRQVCAANVGPMHNSFPTNSPLIDSNVIPRVTTQTPGTQTDAIPAILFLLPPSLVSSSKRPLCFERKESVTNKTFGYDNQNNSAISEADSKKKAKEWVNHLKDIQLFRFDDKESLLHKIVRTADSECVLALLKRLTTSSCNIDIINSKNENSQTPLHLAVQENIPAIVHLLIRYGADVNHLAMTPSKKLEAPLHYVASRGIPFKLVLKCLLEAGDLDINIKNSEGQTALHCAAAAHRTGGFNSTPSVDCEYIVKKLLASGVDPLIQDNTGKNVLMYVIESKDLNLMGHIMKTVSKDEMHKLLTATTRNGQTFLSLTHSLKDQFNQVQWEKIINMLTRHTKGKKIDFF